MTSDAYELMRQKALQRQREQEIKDLMSPRNPLPGNMDKIRQKLVELDAQKAASRTLFDQSLETAIRSLDGMHIYRLYKLLVSHSPKDKVVNTHNQTLFHQFIAHGDAYRDAVAADKTDTFYNTKISNLRTRKDKLRFPPADTDRLDALDALGHDIKMPVPDDGRRSLLIGAPTLRDLLNKNAIIQSRVNFTPKQNADYFSGITSMWHSVGNRDYKVARDLLTRWKKHTQTDYFTVQAESRVLNDKKIAHNNDTQRARADLDEQLRDTEKEHATFRKHKHAIDNPFASPEHIYNQDVADSFFAATDVTATLRAVVACLPRTENTLNLVRAKRDHLAATKLFATLLPIAQAAALYGTVKKKAAAEDGSDDAANENERARAPEADDELDEPPASSHGHGRRRGRGRYRAVFQELHDRGIHGHTWETWADNVAKALEKSNKEQAEHNAQTMLHQQQLMIQLFNQLNQTVLEQVTEQHHAHLEEERQKALTLQRINDRRHSLRRGPSRGMDFSR